MTTGELAEVERPVKAKKFLVNLFSKKVGRSNSPMGVQIPPAPTYYGLESPLGCQSSGLRNGYF